MTAFSTSPMCGQARLGATVITFALALCFALSLGSCDDGPAAPEIGFQIEPDSIELGVDDTATARAIIVEPGGQETEPEEVAWTSLAPQIATVDSTGLVTGRARGDTRIVAVVGDSSATARVIVVDPVVSLTIVPDSTGVAVDDTVQLAVFATRASGAVDPAPEVEWTSLTQALISVDASGRVAGRAPGSAHVRVVSEGLSDDAKITVARWRRIASLPAPRRTGHLAALDGKLYYIGGNASIGEQYVSTTFVFDASTDTWSTAAAMPTARGQAAVAVLGDRIHVIGGTNPAAPDNVDGRVRVHEAYNPATNTWETLAPMSVARSGPRADSLAGRIYVVGGSRGPLTFDSVEVYDPANDSWAPAPSLPETRLTFGIGSIGHRLYVAGGEGVGRVAQEDVFYFDPTANSWGTGTGLPGPRHRVASASQSSRLIVLGGLDAVDFGQALTDVFAYDPAADSWMARPALPVPLVDAAAAVLDGMLYVVGGITPGGLTSRVFVAIP